MGVGVAPKNGKEVREELFRVLLPHRREFLVAFPNERFEPSGLDAFLKHGRGGVMSEWIGGMLWDVGRGVGVSSTQETIGDFVHLTIDAICGEACSAG